MKKTVKSNPLKTFNDNKALAVKKMVGAQAAFKKSLPKVQNGDIIGGPTTPGPVQTAEWKRNKERSKYFTPDNIRIPGTKLPLKISNEIAKEKRDQIVRQGMNMLGYKKGGATKALPKAQLGRILNNVSTLKKIYNMYNTAKQSLKLTKSPNAKKVKKSGVTKVMLKTFNTIKNKKK